MKSCVPPQLLGESLTLCQPVSNGPRSLSLGQNAKKVRPGPYRVAQRRKVVERGAYDSHLKKTDSPRAVGSFLCVADLGSRSSPSATIIPASARCRRARSTEPLQALFRPHTIPTCFRMAYPDDTPTAIIAKTMSSNSLHILGKSHVSLRGRAKNSRRTDGAFGFPQVYILFLPTEILTPERSSSFFPRRLPFASLGQDSREARDRRYDSLPPIPKPSTGMPKDNKETPQPTAATSLPRPRSKRGVRGFLAEVGREMKKVHWPQPKETNRLTGVVLTVCTLLTLLLFLFSTASHEVVRVLTQGF